MKMGWLLSRQEPAGYGSMGRPSLAKRLAMTCKTSSLERINIIWAIFAGHKPHNFEMWILCESWYAVESAQKQPISTHINLLPLGLSHIKWLEVVSRPRARFRFSILMLLHLTGYWFGSCFIAVRSVLLEGSTYLTYLALLLILYGDANVHRRKGVQEQFQNGITSWLLSNWCDLDHLKPLASILVVYTIRLFNIAMENLYKWRC